MIKNDVLRRIRYIFDFDDSQMIAIFALANHHATRSEVSNWLKKDTDKSFVKCPDRILATFLNGLIIKKRGVKESSKPVIPEEFLTNNAIFFKLKIALNLKSEEIIDIVKTAGFELSKHELSAFFRKPGNRHYRECKAQILRNFLNGLQMKYRNEANRKQ